jgi:hypothetical protein
VTGLRRALAGLRRRLARADHVSPGLAAALVRGRQTERRSQCQDLTVRGSITTHSHGRVLGKE